MRAFASLTIGLALLATVLVLAAPARSEQESQSVLPALLTEVRGLRAAMEQMASAGPRVQLALGRLQLQEQRLNTQITRLDTIRTSLVAAQQRLSQQQERLKATQLAPRDSLPPEERDQLEHIIRGLKNEIADSSAEVQRLMADETAMAGELAAEQTRWSEFNQKLEELERTLGRR